MNPYLKIGCYSKKCIAIYGSSIWLDDNGQKVEIYCVVDTEEAAKEFCKNSGDGYIVSRNLVDWAEVGQRPVKKEIS